MPQERKTHLFLQFKYLYINSHLFYNLYRPRAHKYAFNEGDRRRMPLIVFGDGLRNKAHVRFAGLRHGLSEKIRKQLLMRGKLGELLLLTINEYNTSQVQSFIVYMHTDLVTYHIQQCLFFI